MKNFDKTKKLVSIILLDADFFMKLNKNTIDWQELRSLVLKLKSKSLYALLVQGYESLLTFCEDSRAYRGDKEDMLQDISRFALLLKNLLKISSSKFPRKLWDVRLALEKFYKKNRKLGTLINKRDSKKYRIVQDVSSYYERLERFYSGGDVPLPIYMDMYLNAPVLFYTLDKNKIPYHEILQLDGGEIISHQYKELFDDYFNKFCYEFKRDTKTLDSFVDFMEFILTGYMYNLDTDKAFDNSDLYDYYTIIHKNKELYKPNTDLSMGTYQDVTNMAYTLEQRTNSPNRDEENDDNEYDHLDEDAESYENYSTLYGGGDGDLELPEENYRYLDEY